MRGFNLKQIKLEVYDAHEKDDKITTKSKPLFDEVDINKTYLDGNFFKLISPSSFFEKDVNEFKLQDNKKPIEEILIQTAVKTTIPTLHDERIVRWFPNADENSKKILFVKRRRSDLEERK